MSSRTSLSLGVLLLVGVSCSQTKGLRPPVSGESIVVTLTGGTLGSAAAPNAINFNPSDSYTVHLEMHDATGAIDTSFNTWVRISSKPGTVYSIGAADASIISGRNVRLVNGVADGIGVVIVASFGETRVWSPRRAKEKEKR